MNELKGWRVQVNECDAMIVRAANETEAGAVGWREYERATGMDREEYEREYGDYDGTVSAVPALDGGVLTLRRAIEAGVASPGPDDSEDDMDIPQPSLFLSTEI